MKHILLVVAIITTLGCKAQVSPLEIIRLDDTTRDGIVDGAYYKDIDGDLDDYAGTWQYTSGGLSLTLVLQKKIKYNTGDWFEDLLIGEYKYVDNGIELVNTLSNIDVITDYYYNSIAGNEILYLNPFLSCTDCGELESRIGLDFIDLERRYLSNSMIIGYLNDNGVEKIQMKLNRSSGASLLLSDTDARETRLPYGEYILIKQ